MWGSWTPAKVKMAVSGCPRNCAEATCKDVGVICVDSGYDIHFAGAAGLDIKGTELLGHVETEDEAIEAIAALAQLYREQGRYLERIYKWAKRVGLETIRQQIMEDGDRRRALLDRFVYLADVRPERPLGRARPRQGRARVRAVADLTLRGGRRMSRASTVLDRGRLDRGYPRARRARRERAAAASRCSGPRATRCSRSTNSCPHKGGPLSQGIVHGRNRSPARCTTG